MLSVLSADTTNVTFPAASGPMSQVTAMCSKCLCMCEGIRNWVAAKVIPEQPGSAKEDENLPKGEPVTLFRALKDAPRAVDRLLLAPR